MTVMSFDISTPRWRESLVWASSSVSAMIKPPPMPSWISKIQIFVMSMLSLLIIDPFTAFDYAFQAKGIYMTVLAQISCDHEIGV